MRAKHLSHLHRTHPKETDSKKEWWPAGNLTPQFMGEPPRGLDLTHPPQVRALQDSSLGLARNPFSVEKLGSPPTTP